MKKILVVDDSPQIRFLLETFMSEEFEIKSYSTSFEAKQELTTGFRPDLIVLDLGLPDSDGFDFLSSLKSDDYKKFIPVIMLSASEKSADRIKAFELGAEDFVAKPFHPEELKLRIKKSLKHAYYAN